MTEIQQGGIEVIATLVLSVSYYAIAWNKCGDRDHKKLGWIAVTGLGGVTGVFIFIGRFEVMKVSVLSGVWSGIAGIIITLATMTEIIKEFKGLFRQSFLVRSQQSDPQQRKFLAATRCIGEAFRRSHACGGETFQL
jgi:hypothetical protein